MPDTAPPKFWKESEPKHDTLLTLASDTPPFHSFLFYPRRYDGGGAAQASEALSRAGAGGGRADRRVTLAQIGEEGLGLGGAPAWVQVVATVTFLRSENMYYPACPLPFNGKTCNKKLQDHAGDGS